MQPIAAATLRAWLADGTRRPPQLLDVREAWEFQISHIAGSLHIPMGQIPARAEELDAQSDVVVICHHGARSAQVAMYLEKQGFARVHNLVGGVDAWARSVDPAMPVY